MTEKELKYPIGKFEPPLSVDASLRVAFIEHIDAVPSLLRQAVDGLNDHQLDTPYRDGGWTLRQVVHHLPDSHVNAYVRFKLTLTEDQPTIRPYAEAQWAELSEARTGPISLSLDLIDALHRRWVAFLRSLAPDAFDRTYRHPQSGVHTLGHALALYSWHGQHHVAHITSLRSRKGW